MTTSCLTDNSLLQRRSEDTFGVLKQRARKAKDIGKIMMVDYVFLVTSSFVKGHDKNCLVIQL